MKQCFGDLDPQELCAAHISVIFSEPKICLRAQRQGLLFCLALRFQNPSLLSFNKKERSKLLRVGRGWEDEELSGGHEARVA